MNAKTLTLPEAVLYAEAALYGLSGRPFSLLNNMKMCGRSAIRSGRGVRLEYPNRTPSAIADGEQLAKEIQQALSSVEIGSFDDNMRSLRGRSWSL